MTKQESLHILDECIEYLDGLSDEEIDKLATEANEYMAKPFEQIQQSKGDKMPYGNGKALEREFIKKYSEVQLDVEIDEESEDDVRVENSRAIRS